VPWGAGAVGGGVLGPLKKLGRADTEDWGSARAEAGSMPRVLLTFLFFSTARSGAFGTGAGAGSERGEAIERRNEGHLTQLNPGCAFIGGRG